MPTLEEMDCTDNRLTEIPRWVFTMRGRRKLRTSHTRIRELPRKIGRLKNLIHLDPSHNEITHPADTVARPTAPHVRPIRQPFRVRRRNQPRPDRSGRRAWDSPATDGGASSRACCRLLAGCVVDRCTRAARLADASSAGAAAIVATSVVVRAICPHRDRAIHPVVRWQPRLKARYSAVANITQSASSEGALVRRGLSFQTGEFAVCQGPLGIRREFSQEGNRRRVILGGGLAEELHTFVVSSRIGVA